MRILKRVATLGAVVSGVALAILPSDRSRRAVREQLDRVARSLRRTSDRLRGAGYRIGGRRPAPDVADDVLADRIRSTIGPLVKRLDVPHIHVMVEDHVALLHGVVAGADQATQLEGAVARVSGVVGVESYLHVGLGPGDTRPSEGSHTPSTSAAMTRLLDTVEAAGIPPSAAPMVARAVLATFAERLPAAERDHVAAHLPADVRAMFAPPTRTHELPAAHTSAELVARIAAATPELPHAARVGRDPCGTPHARELVPEELGDVAAVLPQDLRQLWLVDEARDEAPTP